MKITVTFDAQLRRWSGTEKCELEFDQQPTVTHVFRVIAEANDEKLRTKLLDDDNNPQKTILTFVNGRALPGSKLGNYQLQDGDKLSLFPPISGG